MPTLTGIPAAPSAGAAQLPTNSPAVPRNYGNATKKSAAYDFTTSTSSLFYTLLVSGLVGVLYLFL
jgi:hypothetical protein